MSFNKFSNQKTSSSNEKPEEKTKTAPAVDAPAAQPGKKQDEAEPAQKS